jgi:acyl-CoA thioester hydrolase
MVPLYRTIVLLSRKILFLFRDFSTSHQKVAAEGDGLIVTFDYRESKKVPVPEELRKKILDLESTTR